MEMKRDYKRICQGFKALLHRYPIFDLPLFNLALSILLASSVAHSKVEASLDHPQAINERSVFSILSEGNNKSPRGAQNLPSTPSEDLAKTLINAVGASKDANLVISPQNCWHALALAYLGADGKSRDELEMVANTKGLHQEAFIESMLQVQRILQPYCQSAATFFVSPQIPILPEYQEVLQKVGSEPIASVDFMNKQEAIKTINSWVSQATEGKITSLVTDQDIDTNTIAMLIAALHFKASWLYPFEKVSTYDAPFRLNGGGASSVRMMHMVESFQCARKGDAAYVVLPYKNEGQAHWEMELFLPSEKEKIMPQQVLDMMDTMRSIGKFERVDLRLPKFKYSMRWDIKESLEKIGVCNPFSDTADFSLMSNIPLKIQKAFQECYIDLSEEGTEGAAATAIGMSCRSGLYEDPIHISFDRPFYFLVRERNSGTLLFFGHVENPSK